MKSIRPLSLSVASPFSLIKFSRSITPILKVQLLNFSKNTLTNFQRSGIKVNYIKKIYSNSWLIIWTKIEHTQTSFSLSYWLRDSNNLQEFHNHQQYSNDCSSKCTDWHISQNMELVLVLVGVGVWVHIVNVIINGFHEEIIGEVGGWVLQGGARVRVGLVLFKRNVSFDQVLLVAGHFLLYCLVVLLELDLKFNWYYVSTRINPLPKIWRKILEA